MEKAKQGITVIQHSRPSCCSKYVACIVNSFNKKKSDSKKYFIAKWRQHISKVVNSKKLNDPFELLTRLWAHKNVIHQLENIRLNPKLSNKKAIRSDLEFYIPQLCSFILFGEDESVEEVLGFLCKACFVSFSFAHKIIWFLKSSIGGDPVFDEKIRTILHIIQTIFKSNKDKTLIESFFLPGSKEYLDSFNKKQLNGDYFSEMGFSLRAGTEETEIQTEFTHSKHKFRAMLNDYIDNDYVIQLEKNGLNNNGMIKEKKQLGDVELEGNEIYLSLFRRYDYVTNDENSISTQYVKQIDSEDVNLSSFLSTVNFIDQLCTVSDRLMHINPCDQKKALFNELKKVNKSLPSNVYLPFISGSIRNYVVSSIPLSEAKIYRTKQRAPFMITVECFRLDELTFYLELYNAAIPNEIDIDSQSQEKDIKKHSKQKSMDSKVLCAEVKDEKFDITAKKRHKGNEKYEHVMKTVNDNTEIEALTDKALINHLESTEAKYSKPLIINKVIKRTGLNFNKDSPISSEDIKKKEIGVQVKKRDYAKLKEMENESSIDKDKESDIGNIIIRLNNNSQLNEITQIDTSLKCYFRSNSTIEKHPQGSHNTTQQAYSYRTPKMLHSPLTFTMSPNGGSDGLNDSKSDEEKEEPSIEEESSSEEDKGNLFGESIEQKTKRLRQLSPFGRLASYRLFDLIVKSGEDLRQEQFATQLINEFNQIFKLSKVKCWLKPYEIIATGHDVGIVEVVSNAISIDQMKRKLQSINSLSEVYKHCFGPINSSRYKQAMKAYIESLAGYSLVCYFLQIKDRHNANILIDDKGHLIHIDFGFMLSNAPGKGIKFEKAPFKLTQDFVDVMGGSNSQLFDKFRKLLWKGFIALAEHCEKILILIEMMFCGHGNNLPCFFNGQETINDLKRRFIPNPHMKKRDYIEHVDLLISQSLGNWRTKWYDKYQYYVQGILA